MKRLVLAVFLIFVGAGSVSAQQISAIARQHFDRGLELSRSASKPVDLDSAIGEFRAVLASEPKFALAWYNLGLVQDAAGRYREAATSLRRYLGLSPGASDRRETRTLIAEIQAKADRSFSNQEIGYVLEGLLARRYGCNSFGVVKRDSAGNLLARTRILYYQGPGRSVLEQFDRLELHGPRVRLLSVMDICDPANPGSCPRLIETTIEILSRTKANLVESISSSTGAVSIAPMRTECVLESPEPVYGPLNRLDNWDMTPLHHAVEDKNYAEIGRLVGTGADPDRSAVNRGTPLDFAILRGDLRAVEALLAAGANPDARDKSGSTPFRKAFGRWEIVKRMLEYGADPTQRSDNGFTLLHEYSLAQAPSIAELLITYGADPSAKALDGRTPLHVLANVDHGEDLARLLIAKGASPNVPERNGVTPTAAALANGKLGLVSLFLAKGANVNERDRFGNPLVFQAVDSGSADAVKLLIAAGADLRALGSSNRMILQAAIGSYVKDPLPVIEALIDAGVAIDKPDALGIAPIARAADDGKLEIVRLLLRRGADPDIADPTLRRTALHRAAERGRLDIVKALLEGGANPNVRDFSGRTPAELADQGKFTEIAAFFTKFEVAPFNEEFDRKNGWSTGNDGEIRFFIENGKFVIDQPVQGLNWHYYSNHSIDSSRDFTLEAKFRFVSGDANNFYGLIWARTDASNYLFFGVTPSGQIGFRKWTGQWIEVANKPSVAVKKGNSENVLTVRRNGADYIFLVNGVEVAKAPFEPFTGRLGFHVNHFMRVEVDWIRLSNP